MYRASDFVLIELLDEYNKFGTMAGRHVLSDTYEILETELESRQPNTQLYFGEPDGEAIILPFELFDENGYEIIEPVAYDNYGEPIW